MGAIDMAKYADRSNIEVLPAGSYKVRLDKWEKCVARTGMEQIRYYATVVDGEHEDKPLIDHLALSDAAHWRVAWFIKESLGWTKEDMQAIGKMEIGSERFNRCLDMAKGRTMFWVIQIDPTYNNNKVTEYIDDPDAGRFDVEELEDVPDWVKNK
jgi:hypothetical protein